MKKTRDMVVASNTGLMEVYMKACGFTIRRMAKGDWSMELVRPMKDNLKMIWHMEREHILIQMDPNTLDSGLEINEMAKDSKWRQAEFDLKDILLMIRKPDKEK